jgi:flavin-dependent dehydrogenase
VELPAPLACDCLVVGGGPAGSTLAALLADSGVRTVLADGGCLRRPVPVETLLPGAVGSFERLGLGQVLAGSAVAGLPRHGVIWGSGEVVWRERGAAAGLAIERSSFDPTLRAHAAACGAVVLARHVVRGPLPAAGPVEVAGPGGRTVRVAARVVAVAAGRAAGSALAPVEVEAEAAATAALSFVGRGDPAFADAAVIEAVPEGWLWWLPLGGGLASVTAFLDLGELRRCGRARLTRAAFGHARGPSASLRDARPQYAVRATPRLQRAAGPFLFCGDAASTLDPLSSQGVEKALASADAAACAVRTMLAQQDLVARAVAHHAAWERGLWHAHARDGATFYAREGRFAAEPFWRARARPAPAPGALPARIRAHPQLARVPVLRRAGDVLVEAEGFAVPGGESLPPVLAGVPLEPLRRALVEPASVQELLARASRDPELFLLAPRDVVEAVRALCACGVVIACAPDGP